MSELKLLSDFNYLGPSMFPLLVPGDGIIIDRSVKFSQLRRGDVIVFKSSQKPFHIVHRLIKITPEGLITRGDNNSFDDYFPVNPEDDPMLVVSIKRGNKTFKVSNGIFGLWVFSKNQILHYIRPHFRSKIKLAMDKTADSGIFSRHTLFRNKLSIEKYNRNGSERIVLFFGRRIIGEKINNSWIIRQPWKLFVNQKIINEIIEKKY